MKKVNFKIQSTCLIIGLAISGVSAATPPAHHGVYDGWSGFYLGTYFGAGGGSAHATLNSHNDEFEQFITPLTTFTDIDITDTYANLSGHVSGSVVDLFVGYNFFEPNFNLVYGLQLEGTLFSDITWKSKGVIHTVSSSSSTTLAPSVPTEPPTISFSTSAANADTEVVDRLHSIFKAVGRVGYLFNPCTLVYALGGPVEGHFVIPAAFDTFMSNRNTWEFGYTLGAGAELKINEHWSLRGEYRYLSFDVKRSRSIHNVGAFVSSTGENLGYTQSTSAFHEKLSTHFNDHLGEIGVVYRF